MQVYSEEEELCAVLERAEGAISYVERYWAGFFPLLLFQVAAEGEVVGGMGEKETALVKELAVLAHRVVLGQVVYCLRFLSALLTCGQAGSSSLLP